MPSFTAECEHCNWRRLCITLTEANQAKRLHEMNKTDHVVYVYAG